MRWCLVSKPRPQDPRGTFSPPTSAGQRANHSACCQRNNTQPTTASQLWREFYHRTAYSWHWGADTISCMKETWEHVYVCWQQGNCQVWTNCVVLKRWTLDLRGIFTQPIEVANVLTIWPWPIRKKTDWRQLNGTTHNPPLWANYAVYMCTCICICICVCVYVYM